MRKSVKVIMVIITILAIILMFSSNVFASSIINQIQQPDTDKTVPSDLLSMAGRVMGIIRTIAVVAGVIILMVIGVKFIIGSAEEKAEYKKSLIPLVVGIVLVMAATTIVSFLFDFMSAK